MPAASAATQRRAYADLIHGLLTAGSVAESAGDIGVAQLMQQARQALLDADDLRFQLMQSRADLQRDLVRAEARANAAQAEADELRAQLQAERQL